MVVTATLGTCHENHHQLVTTADEYTSVPKFMKNTLIIVSNTTYILSLMLGGTILCSFRGELNYR